jgi:type 1 glutamine amidotransferase
VSRGLIGSGRRAWVLAAAAFAIVASVAAMLATHTPLLATSVTRAAGERVRVLLITGGHDFEREPFLQVFRADTALDVTHLEHSNGADAWLRADLEHVDAVVLYDMPRDIDDAQKARFSSIFERGVGLLVMHHALVALQRGAEYERLIRGRYVDVEKGGDASRSASGYQHDVSIPVDLVTPHPVSAGLKDFVIHDEIYWDYQVAPDVVPLLRTSHPKSGNPIAWARTERNSRVVYLQLGHGPSAYEHPSYRRLVANAIRHVAKR